MKRILCLLLCLAMLLPILAGCKQEEKPSANVLKVGYGRVDISPAKGTPLGGYGNPADRLSTTVTEPLYATCIAFTDEKDNTVLLYNLDLTRSYSSAIPMIRVAIGKAVGLPTDNVMVSATHTHSGPDLEHTQSDAIKDYTKSLEGWMIEAAQQALADRKEAKMYTTSIQTEGINHIRHYLLDDGSYMGDNFGNSAGGEILGNVSEADGLLQMVKFTRQDAKDVILVNFQGHPHRDGGSAKTNATADVVGALRSYMEAQLKCNFAYFSGASGNVNFYTRMPTSTAQDYRSKAQAIGQYAVTAAKDFKEVKVGPVTIMGQIYKGQSKASSTMTLDVPMFAFSIGDVAFAMAPYEMWSNNGTAIRESSGFETTFIVTYANMHLFYIPEEEAYDYDSYESGVSRFAKGTAKLLEAEYTSLLKKLYETVNPGSQVPAYNPETPEEKLTTSDVLYWNLDKGTARELTQSGHYRIKLMGADGVKYYLVDGKELIEKLDGMEAFFITHNELFVIQSAESATDKGYVISKDQVTITAITDNQATAKTADGKDVTLKLAANAAVFDMRADQESLYSQTNLRVNDTVSVTTDKNGDVVCAFVHDRIVAKSYCPHCKTDVEWTDWMDSSKLPAGYSGHFKLMSDITLSVQQSMSANTSLILDLNGHVVTGALNKRVLSLHNSGTYLAILDSSAEQTGKLCSRGEDMDEGSCVWVRYGTFELFSGTLDGSQATTGKNGGVVQTAGTSDVFIMHGGTIMGGTSVSRSGEGGNGGNVSITSKMIMYGGLITGGKAIAYKENGTVVRGGLGGNVYIANGGKLFEMYGGTITDGSAEVKEDNVYIGTNSVFKNEGGTVG